MKHVFRTLLIFAGWVMSNPLNAQQQSSGLTSVKDQKSTANFHTGKQLFIDVHNIGPGKLTYEAVAQAHIKDLATEGQFNTEFIKYWVDTAAGKVYCLVSAFDTASIVKTHAKAHGLLPDNIYPVTNGSEAAANGGKNLYLDFHELGAGNVKVSDVAAAHLK